MEEVKRLLLGESMNISEITKLNELSYLIHGDFFLPS